MKPIHQLPIMLIYTRLFIGIVIIILSILKVEYYSIVAGILLSTGLLTDILDGIIARKLNVSTHSLRRLDSTIDLVFFTSFLIATYIQSDNFFKENILKIVILLVFEALTYLISFIKFRKGVAIHSIGAKIWTLLIFATLIQIIIQCQLVLLFNICFLFGLLTRLEIILIILTLKKWTPDVPTFYHALKLRQGKDIKRNKFFNG